jgi:uncharacterized protein
MNSPFIVTSSGLLFPLLKPEPQHVRLRDISRQLSKKTGLNGATREFFSIAQHSTHLCEVLAKRGVTPLIQLHGLLWFAHEAYSNLETVSCEIRWVILTAFGIKSHPDSKEICRADEDLIATEFRDLMPETDFKPMGTPLYFRITPKPWDIAEEKFLKKFHELVAITGIEPMTGALE